MTIQQYFGFTDKAFKSIKAESNANLVKHLAHGDFGERNFHSVIPIKYIDRMACIVALGVIKNGNDQEYLKSVLQVLFAKLRNHSSDAIKKEASRAMCEIHRRVRECLEITSRE